MRWLVELALSAVVLGSVFYVFSIAAPAPLAIASEREVAANAYFVLLRLSADPTFMASVEEAICSNDAARLREALNAVISVRYFYNFSVYLDDVRPPTCLACAEWRQKLASVSRPLGYGGVGRGVDVAVVTAVLSDGTRVRLELSLERP
ncbi:MAG: hypothetical protein ACK4SY_06895 [Pyrobaculum sp.]